MQCRFRFAVDGSAEQVSARLQRCLKASGYSRIAAFDDRIEARRGGGLGGALSWCVERWATLATVTIEEVASERFIVWVRLGVETRFHLVGALEKRLLEAEVATWRACLLDPARSAPAPLREVAKPLRSRVFGVAMLNMSLAAILVCGVGVVGGFPVGWIFLAAIGVAATDGLAILAFADSLVQGAAALPELPRDPAEAAAIPASRLRPSTGPEFGA